MKPSRFSDEQIRHAIAEVADGVPLVTMCRRLGVTPTTFYRWRAKHDGGPSSSVVEVRALRLENQKLRQLVANLSLDRQFLQEAVDRHAKDARRERDA